MSQFLRDALLELLLLRMADYIDCGFGDDEALLLGVEEIRQQIRESRLDLQTRLIDEAIRDARYARERGTTLH
jgi:hypothetical protein